MDRAYSALEVKGVNEEQRVIYGLATSPVPDRIGDVVDQFGAQFAKVIPLFLYHDSRLAVGTVKLGKPTKDGIPFEASLPKIIEPGALQTRVDEAWQMVKYKLIAAVSIGFRGIEGKIERLKTGGMKFLESEILELSLVPIPMQSLATIHTIKSFDTDTRAALGLTRSDGGRHDPAPGASGTKQQPASSGFFFARSLKGINMKTLQELRDARAQKAARMNELLESCKAGDTEMGDAESIEFDALELEVKALDGEIRQKRFDSLNASTAKGVDGSSAAAASASRGAPMLNLKSNDADEAFKGQNFTRMAIAKAMAHILGGGVSAAGIAQARWGKSNPTLVRLMKTNEIAGGGSGSGEWGAELVQADARYTGDFIEFLKSKTVYDKLALRQIPANVTIKGQDGTATGYWVGQSKPIPVSAADFSTVSLTPLKVAALAVISNELLRDSSPAAEMLVRDALVDASSQRIDTTFLSAIAASAGVSPAGLLNGLTPIASAGVDAAGLRADIKALYRPFITAKNVDGLALVMHPAQAKALSLLVNALGQPEFPGLTVNGGTLLGDTVVTGDNVDGGSIILLKPSDIYRIGDTGVEVSMSREAMIEQSTAPSGATDTPVAAGQYMTSMFQAESTAIKVVRSINFAKRRASAVAYINNADYDGIES